MLIGKLIDALSPTKKIKATVVLMRKNVLDFNDFNASIIDNLSDFLGQKVSVELVSSSQADQGQFLLLLSLHFFSPPSSFPFRSPSPMRMTAKNEYRFGNRVQIKMCFNTYPFILSWTIIGPDHESFYTLFFN